MPDKLLARLTPVYVETYAATVMAGQQNWPGGNFGDVIADVRSIVAHMTAGWPRRDSADEFVNRYNVQGHAKRGLGTQLYISGDGTVARLIDLPRRTGHASFVNSWALGVETGNLGDVAPPPSVQWIAASGDQQDISGAKLWITSNRPVQTEVMPAWWTTAGYNGPGRGNIGDDHMLFSEWAYRAWALLARYMFERFELPRNFPLLPHILRTDVLSDSRPFRRVVLADERADMLRRAFVAAPVSIQDVNFNTGNEAALQTEYAAALAAPGGGLKQHNRAWRKLFDVYRGLHGHGFSGAINSGSHDHDCPGPLFDFHRLAREVWDYWWYPFDVGFRFDTETETTAVARREYRRFQADTPLHEYYFDENEAARTSRITTGIHDATGSPDTFVLDEESPVYAMANGELVAARFPEAPPAPQIGVSLAFALVRHEIFHIRRVASIVVPVTVPVLPGLIDFDREPSYVYTLYMHLGRPSAMSFDQISDDNPDWLNRVLIRLKECELGAAFYDDHPTHHGIAPAVWNNRPPGTPARLTTLEAWRADQAALTTFLDTLSTGGVAVPSRLPGVQPIRILLGDFLGEGGVIRNEAGTITHGIRVEVFSRSFVAPTFAPVPGQTGWNPPSGSTAPPCIAYESEWSRRPTDAERSVLAAIGVDADLVNWWGVPSVAQAVDFVLPTEAKLPISGSVVHYRPLDFARWINQVTWTHEWRKYEITDAAGNPVNVVPTRPRSRRV